MLSRVLYPFCLTSALLLSHAATAASTGAPTRDLPVQRFPVKPVVSVPAQQQDILPSVMPAKGSDRLIKGLKARSAGVPVWHSQDKADAGALTPYVINGEDVPEGERSFQVSLQSPFFDHFCGGALIDRQWVLTAGHCIDPFLTSTGFSVFLGSNQLSVGGTRIEVDWVYRHADFDLFTMDNDVALLHLAEPAPEHVPLLALADEAIMEAAGQPGAIATVSGWGATSDSYVSETLQQAEVPLFDVEQCQQSYLEAMGMTITDNMLCAGYPEGDADSCYGDSGGPLTVTADGIDYSVGVVSWGSPGCAEPGLPGVYARTASVKEWIDETLAVDPPTVLPITGLEPVLVDISVGESVYYSVELPEAAREASVSLVGGFGDVKLQVYRGRIPSVEGLLCESTGSASGQSCQLSLTTAGTYSIVLEAESDVQGALLLLDYTPLVLENHTVVSGISMQNGQWVSLPLRLDQTAYDVSITLSGDNGDADLFVYALQAGAEPTPVPTECQSTNGGSYEECYFEVLEPGDYVVDVVAFSEFTDVTLTVDWTDQPLFFPQAICEHSVISQFGQYFVAAITIVNVSGDYLNDWYVEWNYQSDAQVQLMYNGILTRFEPYRAESPEAGRAIAPGGITTLYMLVNSPQQVAENPTVSGNFCF